MFLQNVEKHREMKERYNIQYATEVNKGENYQVREEATKSSEGVSVGAQCSSTQ